MDKKPTRIQAIIAITNEARKMRLLCECNSFDCQKTIDIPFEDAKKIKQIPNSVIIIDGCPIGPDLLDIFVRRESGYSIYKDEEAKR